MEGETVITKARRIGGSIVVTIPAKIVELEQIKEDTLVELKVRKKRVDGFGIMKGLESFTKEDRAKGNLKNEINN